MRRAIAAALASVWFCAPALAASEMECADLFRKADANQDGVVADTEALRYLAALRVWTVPVPADGRLDYAAFVKHCRNDVFQSAVNDPGAPLKGANSFTEAQARDRALARGFADVSPLKKDDDGIWRGTARLESREVAPAVDYRGNVVADPR